jgi:hypothetical protein
MKPYSLLFSSMTHVYGLELYLNLYLKRPYLCIYLKVFYSLNKWCCSTFQLNYFTTWKAPSSSFKSPVLNSINSPNSFLLKSLHNRTNCYHQHYYSTKSFNVQSNCFMILILNFLLLLWALRGETHLFVQ